MKNSKTHPGRAGVVQNDHAGDVTVVHQPPDVVDSAFEWPLRHDEGFRMTVALHMQRPGFSLDSLNLTHYERSSKNGGKHSFNANTLFSNA